MSSLLKRSIILSLLITGAFISGCKSSDEESDDEKVDVGRPANEILQEEGTLHTFKLKEFVQDADEIDDDKMVLRFDNFAPSTTNIEPKEDEDQTLNDLKFSRNNWDEQNITWVSNSNPLLDEAYNQSRPYRILQGSTLQNAKAGSLNKPIYETIDDNIFERQLGASFVWDFGRYGDVRTERDVSGHFLEDYQALYGFDILPEVDIWSDIRLQPRPVFSEGAVIYAASRSVAFDAVVVESVQTGTSYSLTPTRFGTGVSDLASLLSIYPLGGSRMPYQYTVDYVDDYTLYISFNTVDNTAHFYESASGGTAIAQANYTIHSDKPFVEIHTQDLTTGERELLFMPAYFNPVIIGPIGSDYYYGKRYIKTDATNRILLDPVFFFNAKAKQDVESTFKSWRVQEHLDNN